MALLLRTTPVKELRILRNETLFQDLKIHTEQAW